MFDFSFSNILHSNLINFLIVVGFFGIIFWKLKVGEKLGTAHNAEKHGILNSNIEKEKSIFKLQEIKANLSSLGAEIVQIYADGKRIIEKFKTSLSEELKGLEESFAQNTNKMLEIQEEKIKTETKKQLTQICIELSQKRLVEALSADKNLHKKFIEDAVNDIEKLDGAKI